MTDIKSFVQDQILLVPDCCRGAKKSETYLCYTLRSTKAPARTYSGSTNHFVHRIRQHNGLIKGGARATHTDRPWKICCLVYGFTSKSNALRYEYFTKVNHSGTYRATISQGKNSIQRRAALLMTAELKMKPEQRKLLKYFAPDPYMSQCLVEARADGVPGTIEAALSSQKMCYIQETKDETSISSISEDKKTVTSVSENS
jgi:predicted GIY-YIG superfamily endonuclease